MTLTHQPRRFYQELCAEFYDLYKPEAGVREVNFYSALLKDVQGPILEGMCGSGRVLIPLLKQGFVIDGVDESDHMLANCRRRCESKKLQVTLYHQSIQSLSLQKKYAFIYIAGSFPHIAERAMALDALRQMREHLLPGGKIAIEIIIPWGIIKDGVEDGALSREIKTITSAQTVSYTEGVSITLTATTKVDLHEQLAMAHNLYEKTRDTELIGVEEEHLPWRWYYRHEMELLLEKAGLGVTHIWSESFEPHLQSTIYEATPLGPVFLKGGA